VSQFVADVEGIVNESILGSEDDPCQWMCPFDSKKRKSVLSQWIMCEPVELSTRWIPWLTIV
jgi:hypothetical protein